MDPHEIALWRYEQIEDLLDESLTRSQRRRLLRRRARTPVHWPDGDDRPVSEATLYRWIRLYPIVAKIPGVLQPARES